MSTTLQHLSLEQQHATLLLKGWERSGRRSYYKREGEGYVIATAGCGDVVQAMPGWAPFDRGRRILPADVMEQVVQLIDRYEARQ